MPSSGLLELQISCIGEAPVDILCEIFQYVFDNCRPIDLKVSHDRTGFKDRAVVVTHVCRHWRSVALENASFWTFIMVDSFGPEQIKEYLRRSKGLKLELYLSTNSDPESRSEKEERSTLDMVKDYLNYVEALIVSNNSMIRSVYENPQILYSTTNPWEHALHSNDRVNVVPSRDTMWYSYETVRRTSQVIHTSLVSNALPSLRELSLIAVLPSTLPSWLDSLTRFCLHDVEIFAGELLNVLERCSHHLQYLTLEEVRIDSLSILGFRREVINMESIRELSLVNNFQIFSYILPCLRFPEKIKWQVLLDFRGMPYDDSRKALIEHLNNLPAPLLMEHAVLCVSINLERRTLGFSVYDSSQDNPNYTQYLETRQFEEDWVSSVEHFSIRISQLIPVETRGLVICIQGCTSDLVDAYDRVFQMNHLRPLLFQASSMQFVKLHFNGIGGDYAELQAKIVSLLISFTDGEAKSWMKTKTLCLSGFDFKASDRFWDLFVKFMKSWGKPERELKIQQPRNLSDAGVTKIRGVLGLSSFSISGL